LFVRLPVFRKIPMSFLKKISRTGQVPKRLLTSGLVFLVLIASHFAFLYWQPYRQVCRSIEFRGICQLVRLELIGTNLSPLAEADLFLKYPRIYNNRLLRLPSENGASELINASNTLDWISQIDEPAYLNSYPPHFPDGQERVLRGISGNNSGVLQGLREFDRDVTNYPKHGCGYSVEGGLEFKRIHRLGDLFGKWAKECWGPQNKPPSIRIRHASRLLAWEAARIQKMYGLSSTRTNLSPSRPNLSFNPDPTVGCCVHVRNIRLTVGPVNFVR